MERNSLMYKTRRKIQLIAHLLFPDVFMSKLYYRILLKKKLNLNNPKTFNEKMQWLKLYYFPENPTVIQCSDKVAVRDYVKQKGLGDILVPQWGTWDNADQIDWEALPKQFVLKCNHGCAYNILCHDKEKFDIKSAKKQLNAWIKEDFGAFNIEPHYSRIKQRKILCEKYLGACITDYKFFCFNGEPQYIYVATDMIHDRQSQMGFFYIDGKRMPMKRNEYAEIGEINHPYFFEEMRSCAKVLSRDFPFVRVDFFVFEDRYYFAELTFTPGACVMQFNPDRFDLEWGKQLDISAVR